MIRPFPREVRHVLAEGSFCHLAVPTSHGPHVTPLVYALHRGRLWVTTARRSVKVRAWRRDPRVGGLVRAGGRAVSFSGRVVAYDLLEPATWGRSVAASPRLTAAAMAFTRKNARFFAGYAVDATKVPLAWTPPGRVFAEIELETLALIDEDGVRTWGGSTAASVDSRRAFRGAPGRDPIADVPDEVQDRLEDGGPAVLAVGGPAPPTVLPVRWTRDRGSTYAVLAAEALRLAGGGTNFPTALAVDHASRWRATEMTGLLVQGTAAAWTVDELESGARSAAAIAARTGLASAEGAALVRIRPARVVWWRGWRSGTVEVA